MCDCADSKAFRIIGWYGYHCFAWQAANASQSLQKFAAQQDPRKTSQFLLLPGRRHCFRIRTSPAVLDPFSIGLFGMPFFEWYALRSSLHTYDESSVWLIGYVFYSAPCSSTRTAVRLSGGQVTVITWPSRRRLISSSDATGWKSST